MWHNFGTHDDYENMKNMCFTAFDNGITHFDLANNYGPEPGSAEINTGKIIREEFGAHRDELVISTKAGYEMWDGPYGNWGSRKYLIASLDQSLKRMGLDYVDIFYHHRMDKNTPLEETMEALSQIVKSGKALYVGLSNYDGATLIKAEKIFCFSPLAQGMLTDKYLKDIPADSRVVRDGRFLKADNILNNREHLLQLNAIATEAGLKLSEMAICWLLNKPEVTTVLIGASRPEQIIANIEAYNKLPLFKEIEQSI